MKINQCCLKDIKAREAKLQEVAESRAGFVGAAILLILYGIVSNMEYYDCIKLGVC